MVKSDSVLFCF